MKLLNCLACNDILALRVEARVCACGQSGGRYLSDGLHAEYHGPARVLGLRNQDYCWSRDHPPTKPYEADYPWFVIGEWARSHVRRTDAAAA